MPDEERVKKKRRKLDSIISKLHQTNPSEKEGTRGEAQQNDTKKENDNGNETRELLPRVSRRKAAAAPVKQKNNDEDPVQHPEGEVDEEAHVVENAMEIDNKQEVPCYGEDSAVDDVQPENAPVVKQEPIENYENSLDGLQKMLGYDISEEVQKQKEHGKEKKKKEHTSENLDTDAELPRRVQCTACGRQVNPAHGTVCRHPNLNVLVCKKCSRYFNSGPFTRDEFGVEEQCRWCGDGGSLLCCDKCEKAFCKPCIKRNLGKAKLKEIVDAPEDTEWLCFCCNSKPLSQLLKSCNRIMNILDLRKAQKSLFKSKKGPSLKEAPNQKERRNRLCSISENMGMSSDGALSPSESPTKKTAAAANLIIDSDGDSDEGNDQKKNRKRSSKIEKKKHAKKNGSAKEDVLVIDDSDSDDDVVVTSSKGKGKKNAKGQGKSTSKKKTKIRGESDNKKDIKKSKVKNNRTRKDSSSESDSNDKNQDSKRIAKAVRKTKKKDKSETRSSEEDSDFSDFVSMVRTKDGLQKEKKSKKQRGKGKKQASDKDSEDESDNVKRKTRSKKASVSQKQTRKRPRMVTSSEEKSSSSADEKSDSDVPAKRRKMLQAQKSKKKQRIASEDSDESDEEIASRKKGKSRKKTKRSSSESDEDRKKKRTRKGTGKQKKGRKKHQIGKDSDDSENNDDEEEEEDEEVSPSKKKGRKKIRKLIEDEKLAEETRKARRLEEERRKRLLERTRANELDDLPTASAKVSTLVLEADPDTKGPLVEIKEDLLQHLKPHQSKGIQFMYDCVIESLKSWKKEEPGGGCILAHCMGLGKTLQVVALVHTLMTHPDIKLQSVLVVAPLNTVLNWQVEFEKWLAVDDRLEVYILQEAGGNNWRRVDMLKHWMRHGGVMIMGYSLYRNLSQCYRIRSKHQKKAFQESLVDPGPDLVVCDEGHILRNDASAISKALNAIKTKRRIVLTGTPLQNNLIEYHCMVSFVKPNLLGTRKEFTNTFVNPIQNGQCADSTALDVQIMKQRCHVLHKMLEGCVQRKDYAALIPFLPRKHEYVIKVRLSASQRKLYEHYLKTFVFPDGDVGKRGVSLFSDYQCLMRIWTHPWCLKLDALRRPEQFLDTDSMDDFVVHTDEEDEEEEGSESVQSTTSEEENQVESSSEGEDKRKTVRGKKSKQIFSSDEEESDDEENESEDEVLPQSSRKKNALASEASSASNRAGSSTVNIGGEDITVVKINDGASTSRDGISSKKDDAKPSTSKDVHYSETNNSVFGSTRSGASFKDEPDVEIEEEKEWYDEFLQDDDEYNVELSGKLVLLMEILADAEAVNDKVLVFSQSLVTLDLIEKMLGGGEIGGDRENWCRGCDYFRMDGSTSAAMRQRWADIFNDDDNKTARLFLISTKAGGLGINLVAANRVVVFDVSWNPSHDVQSIFRVYRFGQSKAVFVYRLIAQGTMEEKIYDRQVTKLSLSSRVVDEQQIERHFTAADLRELYMFTPDILDEEKEKDAEAEVEAGEKSKEDGEGGTDVSNEMAGDKDEERKSDQDDGLRKESDRGNETEKENGETQEKEGENSNNSARDSESDKAKEGDKVEEQPALPLPKDAVLADLIVRLHPRWIVKYHEHDSMLQNIESEELTPEEMRQAWEAYEAEKSGQIAPAYNRSQEPPPGSHAHTQMQVAQRIRINSEMLKQIQQIHQLQEIQQRQELQERAQLARQEQERLYQQRHAVYQQHQRQQDEIRRQNQLRFIQHMTQQPAAQGFQIGQNTVNVQTTLPAASQVPQASFPRPGLTYQPLRLSFQVPPNVRLPAPGAGTIPVTGAPPTINSTLGPATPVSTVRTLPNNAQVSRP
ncbi:transcriptional regulator ATRX-like isoform X2 [Stylophora pistillata]|uniref:transcriptional regulator ATRX-like isoform X2 n=1 Tax=Stylophora pistillata TaxID=50429 RepID=UPI000C0511E5|nr:transcriptional regulator ATRX-like isoform X2 [Stylophora pistillata]